MQALRLCATDIAWAVGDGPTVLGPIGALLLVLAGRRLVLAGRRLVLAGRRVALGQLSGPGAAELTARLTVPAAG